MMCCVYFTIPLYGGTEWKGISGYALNLKKNQAGGTRQSMTANFRLTASPLTRWIAIGGCAQTPLTTYLTNLAVVGLPACILHSWVVRNKLLLSLRLIFISSTKWTWTTESYRALKSKSRGKHRRSTSFFLPFCGLRRAKSANVHHHQYDSERVSSKCPSPSVRQWTSKQRMSITISTTVSE